MNNQTRSLLASASPRIQAALQDYLDRVDKGEQIDAEAFLIRHAEIADELRSFIAVDQQARQLAGEATPKAGSPGPEKIEGKAPQTKAEVSTHSVVGNIDGTVGGKLKTPDVAAPVVSVARSPADLPDVFGRYRVQKKLGSGAMGAVYLADDTLLDRRVALKTPTFENDQEGELLRRFYREARAVANLKHPNLCAVYDVGEIDGRHYISMEFVRGKKLQDYIKPDKPMAEKQVMAVIRKIALAMHEAHSHGVIHRDLKPDNIMVNEKGEPVVMDFGLVYKSESKNSTRITQRGMLVGSPAYMSKEQVEGDPEKLTAATDQYSLGVILYQLLTAKLPFDGGIHGVLAAILTKDPTPPSQLRPDVNPHLEAICLKMMAKEAKDRYPSMKAVAYVILEVSKGTSKAAGSVVVAEPAAQSLTDGLTATFAGASLAEPQSLPALKVNDSLIKSRIRRATQKGSNGLLYSCLTAGMFLLLAVIFWIRSGQALVKVEVLADDVQVTFDNETLSLIESGKEYRVTPGEHTLHIKSKDTEFDTAKFTLKRGENPVVVVEVVVSEIVARFGNDVIAGHPANIPAAAQGEEKEATSQIHSGSPQEQPDFNGMKAGETRIIAGQRYVWCPPGTFRMGSDAHETERRNHGNPVEVRITNGFWLSEMETTQRQFQEVMNKAPWKGQLYAKDSPNLAASYIDHYDATEFCVKKSQIEHDASCLPVSWHFALPTEAQWEYACRAGTTTAFSFGDVEEQLIDYAWFGISRDAPLNAFAHEGGRKKPNQWGIYDMSGNVWEWCSDWYAEELVGGRDPIGPQSGTLRILRGGSWQDGSRCGRVGLRNRYSASDRVYTIGFRVAIVPRTVTTIRALNDPGPDRPSDGGISQSKSANR